MTNIIIDSYLNSFQIWPGSGCLNFVWLLKSGTETLILPSTRLRTAPWIWYEFIRDVWFNYFLFLFLFSRKIENNYKNTFDWIFENIFSKNIFSNKPKTKNNKISFWIKIKNLILDKIKNKNAVTRNIILNQSKNIFPFENVFLIFLFLENKKKSNQICF